MYTTLEENLLEGLLIAAEFANSLANLNLIGSLKSPPLRAEIGVISLGLFIPMEAVDREDRRDDREGRLVEVRVADRGKVDAMDADAVDAVDGADQSP